MSSHRLKIDADTINNEVAGACNAMLLARALKTAASSVTSLDENPHQTIVRALVLVASENSEILTVLSYIGDIAGRVQNAIDMEIGKPDQDAL